LLTIPNATSIFKSGFEFKGQNASILKKYLFVWWSPKKYLLKFGFFKVEMVWQLDFAGVRF
jgi:hypothetical protein